MAFTKEQEFKILNTIETMTKETLTDPDLMTDVVINRIKKALEINHHYTSTYALENVEVTDINGNGSKYSGFYFSLTGTKTSVRFFLNNDMQITRKPRKAEVKAIYRFKLEESFYKENF